MSNQLSSSNIEPFLNRFYRFYDSVIRTIAVIYQQGERCITVCIEAKDQESQSGWSHVEIEVRRVEELKLIEDKTTNVVLSGGVFIREFDGIMWIAFNPYYPYSELLECPNEFRESTFVIAGHLVSWKSAPI